MVEAIQNKTSIGRESQVQQHVSIRQNKAAAYKTDWQKEVAIYANYQAYQESFNGMLAELKSM